MTPDALLFLVVLTIVTFGLCWWGFTVLPGERWQVLATVPLRRVESGGWVGLNLTWYGLLSANAYLAAVAVALVLFGSVGVSIARALALVGIVLAACVPAARAVARIVEKKAHTLTVGGAVFVGTFVLPLTIFGMNRVLSGGWREPLPVMPLLAATAIAYAFGEGYGRLACISFGCCYGKPVSRCRGLTRRLFARMHFIFHGATKKVAYEGGLDGQPVVPVQALTTVIYTGTGIAGTALFFAGRFRTAFLLVVIVTQLWRWLSEMLRADYRGGGRLSVYQIMALIGVAFNVVLAGQLPPVAATPFPAAAAGLRLLWQPAILLSLQVLWAALFLHTGCSRVTGATLALHVHRERI
ncbi:MAG: prolipoprotein diacylglyceryl transferase [Deltaproteobacteria bacterium]|nr:prolipoprotein diacylglyceryl transferase [Candidatus Anaeroferrophillacea bacterium]